MTLEEDFARLSHTHSSEVIAAARDIISKLNVKPLTISGEPETDAVCLGCFGDLCGVYLYIDLDLSMTLFVHQVTTGGTTRAGSSESTHYEYPHDVSKLVADIDKLAKHVTDTASTKKVISDLITYAESKAILRSKHLNQEALFQDTLRLVSSCDDDYKHSLAWKIIELWFPALIWAKDMLNERSAYFDLMHGLETTINNALGISDN